mmetsp:Transcript_94475/g.148701  ORF Transcript_94475/g.148701 Transcript_94475/m.148701 type:complete len:491 (-) Transcript_94475:71-1543(-)
MMRRVQSEPKLSRVQSEPKLSRAKDAPRFSYVSAASAAYLPGRDPPTFRLTPNSQLKYALLQHNGVGHDRPASVASRVDRGLGRPRYCTEIKGKDRTLSHECRERIKAAMRSRDLKELQEAYRKCFNNKYKEQCYVTTREVKPLQKMISRFHDEELEEAIGKDDKKSLLKAIQNTESDDTIAVFLGEDIPPIMLSRPPKLTEAKLLLEKIEKNERRADAKREPEPPPDFSKKNQAPEPAPPEEEMGEIEEEEESPAKQPAAAEEKAVAEEKKVDSPPQLTKQPSSLESSKHTVSIQEAPPVSPVDTLVSPGASEVSSKAEKRKSKAEKRKSRKTIKEEAAVLATAESLGLVAKPVQKTSLEESNETATPTPRLSIAPVPAPPPVDNGSTSPPVAQEPSRQEQVPSESAAPKATSAMEATQARLAELKAKSAAAKAQLSSPRLGLADVQSQSAAPNPSAALEAAQARLADLRAKQAAAKALAASKAEAQTA